jgi:LacI family transcriptional regulator
VKDVAREAGVSIASVSGVINGNERVAEETRRRVIGAIRRLKYIPHYGAASLVTRRNNLIGVLLPALHGEFFSELVCGIEEAARKHGLHVLLCNSTGRDEEDARTLGSLHGRVGGLLVMASHLRQEMLAEHLPVDTPAVLMNTLLDGNRSMLMIDNYGAAMQVIRHLAGCGRR